MATQALIPFVTLGLSLTSVGVLSRLYKAIRYANLATHIDQIGRAVMLAFAIFHIGAELQEAFTLSTLVFLCGIFLLLQYLFTKLYQYSAHYFFKQQPWLVYTLLIPHFITEGFAIAPHASNHLLDLVIIGFLVHKTIEITMLTISTNHKIPCKKQRVALQSILILLTPLATYLYYPLQHLLHIDKQLMAYTEFLNFIVFVQLATMCQFCDHNNAVKHSWTAAADISDIILSACSVCLY